jgi:hypothetical protein
MPKTIGSGKMIRRQLEIYSFAPDTSVATAGSGSNYCSPPRARAKRVSYLSRPTPWRGVATVPSGVIDFDVVQMIRYRRRIADVSKTMFERRVLTKKGEVCKRGVKISLTKARCVRWEFLSP